MGVGCSDYLELLYTNVFWLVSSVMLVQKKKVIYSGLLDEVDKLLDGTLIKAYLISWWL